jgi:hypothetical protein
MLRLVSMCLPLFTAWAGRHSTGPIGERMGMWYSLVKLPSLEKSWKVRVERVEALEGVVKPGNTRIRKLLQA